MFNLYNALHWGEKMDKLYLQNLINTITDKDNLKLVREESMKYYQSHSVDECFATAEELYQSEYFQIQEIAILLFGYIGSVRTETLSFLRDTVSQHPSWKVQEVLAMAFDAYCKSKGYKDALPDIKEWLGSDCANTRRAVSEGLRIWTSRPYFKDNPLVAISLLSEHKDDESEYFRKSVGNSLRDISKKFPELIKEELETWDTSSKQVMQVYKLAGKLVFTV